jgi:hypothetical protein
LNELGTLLDGTPVMRSMLSPNVLRGISLFESAARLPAVAWRRHNRRALRGAHAGKS